MASKKVWVIVELDPDGHHIGDHRGYFDEAKATLIFNELRNAESLRWQSDYDKVKNQPYPSVKNETKYQLYTVIVEVEE